MNTYMDVIRSKDKQADEGLMSDATGCAIMVTIEVVVLLELSMFVKCAIIYKRY